MLYVRDYVPQQWKDSLRTSCVPENWEQLRLLVASDTLLEKSEKTRILELSDNPADPDVAERTISSMKSYRYLREKLYPKLRSVRFDFYLHRKGMVKDTVHTTELDSVYMAGVEALRNLEYKKAVSLLRPYGDFNSALAFMAADYNHSALDVLGRLDESDPRVCYLKAMVLSRLEQHQEAEKYYRLAVAMEPSLEYRANLDPEMFRIVNNSNF
jgi:tetratricopeptide (TPR) repeat protein